MVDHILTPERQTYVDGLIAQGYRRTSNRYGMVSRIDRPDWIEVLAAHLRRSPAELYVPGEPDTPSASWMDYYRRVLSEDTLEIDPNEARRIPNSNWDPCGYTPKEGDQNG